MPSCSSSNSPVLSGVQHALGLTQNNALFSEIRDSGCDLLKKAGILFSNATDQAVQGKKREVAAELEQLYPTVFGASPGETRDFELQKTTSYALLTSAMDSAKRELRKQKTKSTSGRSFSPKRPIQTPKVAHVSQPRECLVNKPLPQPLSNATTQTPALAESIALPADSSAPVDIKDLMIEFHVVWQGLTVDSIMKWSDLVDLQNPEVPLLSKLQDCLFEDGVVWNPETHKILNMDRMVVQSNRTLKYALEKQGMAGKKIAVWSIVPLAGPEKLSETSTNIPLSSWGFLQPRKNLAPHAQDHNTDPEEPRPTIPGVQAQRIVQRWENGTTHKRSASPDMTSPNVTKRRG